MNSFGKFILISLFVLGLMTVTFALTTLPGPITLPHPSSSGSSDNLSAALMTLCSMTKTFLGAAALLLIVLAGAVYAIGQIMGAETRARASVWATAMLTGAVIGAIIYIISPFIVAIIIPHMSTTC
jgi:hypothetical protein